MGKDPGRVVRVGTQYENFEILAWETNDKRPRFIPKIPLVSLVSCAQPRAKGGVIMERENVNFSRTRLPSAKVPSA